MVSYLEDATAVDISSPSIFTPEPSAAELSEIDSSEVVIFSPITFVFLSSVGKYVEESPSAVDDAVVVVVVVVVGTAASLVILIL